IKGYSLIAKEKGGYVGEFTWDAKQKNGPEYEVTLLWRDGNDHRVAVWRVDLERSEVRPQGDAASGLPQRARDGIVGESAARSATTAARRSRRAALSARERAAGRARAVSIPRRVARTDSPALRGRNTRRRGWQ